MTPTSGAPCVLKPRNVLLLFSFPTPALASLLTQEEETAPNTGMGVLLVPSLGIVHHPYGTSCSSDFFTDPFFRRDYKVFYQLPSASHPPLFFLIPFLRLH